MRNISNEKTIVQVCAALHQLPSSPSNFTFYPFTNEEGLSEVIQNLRRKIPVQGPEMPVAILTGESI